MIVVADTSALIALSLCDSLHLLELVFGKVVVSQSVYNECVVRNKQESDRLKNYLKDKIENFDNSQLLNLPSNLGQGEVSAMLLYKMQNADYLLIDDVRARKVAKYNNINVIGSMGVLLVAKEKGLINEISSLVNKIANSNIFISNKLIEDVKRLANE